MPDEGTKKWYRNCSCICLLTVCFVKMAPHITNLGQEVNYKSDYPEIPVIPVEHIEEFNAKIKSAGQQLKHICSSFELSRTPVESPFAALTLFPNCMARISAAAVILSLIFLSCYLPHA